MLKAKVSVIQLFYFTTAKLENFTCAVAPKFGFVPQLVFILNGSGNRKYISFLC